MNTPMTKRVFIFLMTFQSLFSRCVWTAICYRWRRNGEEAIKDTIVQIKKKSTLKKKFTLLGCHPLNPLLCHEVKKKKLPKVPQTRVVFQRRWHTCEVVPRKRPIFTCTERYIKDELTVSFKDVHCLNLNFCFSPL